jgi:histidine triad (HIT) family protein
MTDCIFCKIANGEIPSNLVYQDEKVFAFLDNSPIEKGHVLVIPKEHYENILDIPEDLLSYMYTIVKRITKAISQAFDVKDFNILQNNGTKAGQTVFHYHIHIVPRYREFKLCLGEGNNIDGEEVRVGQEKYCSKDIAQSIIEKF